ncbi:MAG: hypothetical protein M3357_10260 [Actinomycetota bacterium]|nr:hypothetical protein [Actinomycetota bacterium]
MGTGTPDINALVAQLRARVEERRRQGAYPPGLEHQLDDQARLLLHRRVHTPRRIDVAGPLARLQDALPLSPQRIPAGPRPTARSALHRLAAILMERQTQKILEQVQDFAEPVSQALVALTAAVEELNADVRTLRPPLHAVLERQAVEERLVTQAAARQAAAAARAE